MNDPIAIIGIAAIIVGLIAFIAVLISSTKSDAQPSDPERYRVTLDLGGGETKVYECKSYDYGDGELILYRDDDSQVVVSGSYTVERIRPAKVSLTKGDTTAPADARFKFMLFQNGEVAKTLYLSDYDIESCGAVLTVVGSDDRVVTDGSFVIEPVQLAPAANPQTGDDDDERFNIQLFQNGRVVRSLVASSYESENGTVTLYQLDCEDPVIFCGTFVVEPY